ncbi:DNA/RNA helicase domain-containing protein [Lichenicoccus sp.]|uniref:DNA/RNA helicase domain-containing protein n=1 Tax=Lichenicoccus sp. TaxID=2781899 RepID=UPI003D0ECA71
MNSEAPPANTKPSAWWSGNIAAFLAAEEPALIGQLTHVAARIYRTNEVQQLRAWSRQIEILRLSVAALPEPAEWHLLIEFEIPRLRGRIDAVLLSPRAIFVLEFKIGAEQFNENDRQQTMDYALDLQDFHAGSRRHPILPILIATDATPGPQMLPFVFPGAAPAVLHANAASLPALLSDLAARLADPPVALDVRAWEHAVYRPVPNVIDAACLLFSRHDVAEIVSARADTFNLTRTTDCISALIGQARATSQKTILFVTGIPGAGKTLCGLNAAFGVQASTGAAFLTGNPTLVHVLREALVRNAMLQGERRSIAEHRIKAMIQALPAFRDDLVRSGAAPPERVIIIDEAQRSWTAAQAIAKTRDRPVQLDRSEPAHLLDIMVRHADFAVIVCLIGNGQEIHDGEGGLAEWGDAVRTRPEWRVAAAPQTLSANGEPRNRLPELDGMILDADLHLTVPVRSLRHDAAPGWVDAVLRADAAGARAIITQHGEVPFRLTRRLDDLRAGLRAACRDVHRAGLVCSAAARRLRAEGLGAELPHMDADAVARWFLDRYPRDVRASDALEQVATQFSVQGLELDHVGLCWDGDLIRLPSQQAWQVRSFRGTAWQIARDGQKIAYRLNTYRVLLTRARFNTIIWVPAGDQADRTRDPRTLDEIAAFLRTCGVRDLDPAPLPKAAEPPPPSLLPADG